MNNFILLHGAWHGAWCWKKTSMLLIDSGYSVITPEIPWTFHSRRQNHAVGFKPVVDELCDLIKTLNTRVILVGHSMAGILVSMVASKIPDSVNTAIYISAFIPENGQAVKDLDPLMSDSVIAPHLVIDEKKKSIVIPDEYIRQGLYHDCDAKDYLFARSRLRPQLAFSFTTPVNIHAGNLSQINKKYIECLDDRALPLSAQRVMQKNLHFNDISAIKSSHSPFFSIPEQLVIALTQRYQEPDGAHGQY